MNNTVGKASTTGSVVLSTASSPYAEEALVAKALDVLAAEVSTNRKGAWQQVLPLVPEYSKDIRDLVRALARTPPRRSYATLGPAKYSLSTNRKRTCRICHRDLPHRDPKALSRHGHFMRLYAARKHRWSKYPSPQDRTAQTALARGLILAARHDRWIAALRAAEPDRTEHLLKTQGRSAALGLFRSLSHRKRRKLLAAVPPPPKRLYKGEKLVALGLRPYRPPKLKYLIYHAKGTP